MRLNDLGPMAIAIVIVTIVLSLGALVLSETQDNAIQTQDKSTTTDKVTAQKDTEVDLTGEHYVSIDEVVNASDASDVVSSSNYEVQNNNFYYTGTAYDGEDVNVTHSYYTENYAYNSTGEGLSGIDTTAGFLPVIAIVIIAAIIIGIVGRSFGQNQGGM